MHIEKTGWVSLSTILLTQWGRVKHICVGKLTIIGSDNCLTPGCYQAINWRKAGKLSIGPPGTNFSEISIGILFYFSLGFTCHIYRDWDRETERGRCKGQRESNRLTVLMHEIVKTTSDLIALETIYLLLGSFLLTDCGSNKWLWTSV